MYREWLWSYIECFFFDEDLFSSGLRFKSFNLNNGVFDMGIKNIVMDDLYIV